MPTIVGILTFMSRINFSLKGAEHEEKFITSGPGIRLLRDLPRNSVAIDRSRTIIVDLLHRLTVIHMNDMNLFGQ